MCASKENEEKSKWSIYIIRADKGKDKRADVVLLKYMLK